MRYIRYLSNNEAVYGVIKGERVYKINGSIYGDFTVTDNFSILSEVKILAPSEPTKIVAVGKNYLDHINEFGGPVPETPILFIKPTSAIIAHNENIIRPSFSNRVDYEGELAFIVKKTAKNVKAADFKEYISGYTCLNDVTARDIQSSDGQWTRAKGCDTFAPFGPVVTDEIDPDNVRIVTSLNGEIKQSSNTNCFIWKTAQLFEFITSAFTLYPGDVVTTGTPSGVGPMVGGDVVKVEIENVGLLVNYVI